MADPRAIERTRRQRNLDRVMTWREVTATLTGRGETEVTYTDHRLWAKRIEASDMSELEGQDAVRELTEHRYLMRYRKAIKPRDLLIDGEDTLRIGHVEEIDRRRWLLVAGEIVR